MADFEYGERVRNTETGEAGKFLRLEKYPKVGIQATVKWDWAMFARRVDPKLLERDI